MNEKTAVVLFSGGLDSTTALYWARKNFSQVTALIFYYSQRHNIEVKMAEKIATRLGIEYRIEELPLQNLVKSALINREADIPESLATSRDESGMPFTYVPFRNGILLAVTAAFAESKGIFNLVTGFNCIDTPDYPDTTETFTKKMEEAINQGTSASKKDFKFKIQTPLIKMTKREIIQFGYKLDADYSYSISCYRGDERPCLACPSCDIRSRAFEELGIEDPLIRRLREERD